MRVCVYANTRDVGKRTGEILRLPFRLESLLRRHFDFGFECGVVLFFSYRRIIEFDVVTIFNLRVRFLVTFGREPPIFDGRLSFYLMR